MIAHKGVFMRKLRIALAVSSFCLFLAACSGSSAPTLSPGDQDTDNDSTELTEQTDGDGLSADGDEAPFEAEVEAEVDAETEAEAEAEAETEADIEAESEAETTEASADGDLEAGEELEEEIELYDWPAGESALDGYVVRMIKDIATEPNSSNAAMLLNAKLGTEVLFTASRPWEGSELWKTDGTAEGTLPVKDIYPGPNSSTTSILAAMEGFSLLSADDGVHGEELWRTDGTEAGTTLVKEFFPGADSSRIGFAYPMAHWNGKALLIVSDSKGQDTALWASDGTESGTEKLFALSEFASGLTQIYGFQVWQGALYFLGSTSTEGNILFKSDGTAAGTSVLASGLDFGVPHPLGANLIFLKKSAENLVSLWKTDGTPQGTIQLKAFDKPYTWCSDIINCDPMAMYNSNYATLGVYSDRFWFQADDVDHGPELWVSDGTAAGTTLFADLNPGAKGSYPKFLATSGPAQYFIAYEPAHGSELWKTLGTPLTTTQVKDIFPGANSGLLDREWNRDYGSDNYAQAADGRLFFVAHSTYDAHELWVSDGTETGTRQVKNFEQSYGLNGLTWQGDHLLFVSDGELWKSDGTESGTQQVLHVNPANQSSSPHKFNEINGRLLFFAHNALWSSDSTEIGTRRIFANFTPGLSPEIQIKKVNGRLFFGNSPTKGFYNTDLWQSDGTAAGTTLVKSFDATANLELFTEINKKLFFLNGSRELWQSDGTANGTFKITELPKRPNAMLATDEHLFLATGTQLLVGTPNGDGIFTAKEFEAQPNLFGYSLSKIGNTVFFLIKYTTLGYQLWKSDGTAGGTQLFLALQSAAAENSMADLTSVGDALFFTIKDPTNGYDAWVSDGTLAGTTHIAHEDAAKVLDQYMPYAKKFGPAIYFWTVDSAYTYTLWKTDGTSAGTLRVRAFPQNVPTIYTSQLTEFEGRLYFPEWDADDGMEPWATDGTPDGTFRVADIAPGKANSYPWEMFALGRRLFLSAADNLHGTELWVLEPKAAR